MPAPVQLEYESPSQSLVRPWHLWVGVVVASLWFLTLGYWAALGMLSITGDSWTEVAAILLIASFLLACSIGGLVQEWLAITKYSATASAGVGILMTISAGLVSVGMAGDALEPVAITLSFILSAGSHFLWTRRILATPAE